MKLRPLHAGLVVRVLEAEEKTAVGLIIPEQAKKAPDQGTVLAVGKAVDGVNLGDTVMFAPFAGTKFKLDEDDVLLLDESDLLAVVEKD